MSVPFDRLYTFLRDVSDHDVLIYRWNPAGSRNLEHCLPLTPRPNTTLERYTAHYLVCHDQEPLRFADWPDPEYRQPGVAEHYSRLMTVLRTDWTVWDRVLLCHSELNSSELIKFEQDGAIGVYWWSHAMIARDWFRYAQHDPALYCARQPTHPFLIYNRAWSGSREYRLTFADQLIRQALVSQCKTTMSFVDGQHYGQHEFKNPALSIDRKDFEKHFVPNSVDSAASADYQTSDYTQTAFEIVLETLFDDTRLHLTEKTLRPIACGQPFMLLAPAGSLALLRQYGFQTFDHVWSEQYDNIADPVQRMNVVLDNMRWIAGLSSQRQQQLRAQCQAAVDHNRRWFFSAEFENTIVQEFKSNLDHAVSQLEQHCSAAHLKQFVAQGLGSQDLTQIWHWLQQRTN